MAATGGLLLARAWQQGRGIWTWRNIPQGTHTNPFIEECPDGLNYECYRSLIAMLFVRLDHRLKHLLFRMDPDQLFRSAFTKAADAKPVYNHGYSIPLPHYELKYATLFRPHLSIAKEDPNFHFKGPAPGSEWIPIVYPLLNDRALWGMRHIPVIEFSQRLACAVEREVFEASRVEGDVKFEQWRDELREVVLKGREEYPCYGCSQLFDYTLPEDGEAVFTGKYFMRGGYDEARMLVEAAERVIAAGGFLRDDAQGLKFKGYRMLLLAKSQLPFVKRLLEQVHAFEFGEGSSKS